MSAPDLNAPPQIADWPESYIEVLLEGDLYDASEAVLLAALVAEHSEMRFGRHINLNVRDGFYLHPGNGQVTRTEDQFAGHRVEVLHDVFDGITITRDNVMSWSRSEVADWYVDRQPEKMKWIFTQAQGPWTLTAEYHERKGIDFYFLIVRFLSGEDDDAFCAAFPEVAR